MPTMVEVGETDPGIREDNELRTIHYREKEVRKSSSEETIAETRYRPRSGDGAEVGRGFLHQKLTEAQYAARRHLDRSD